ncbi:hypothetical protein HanHA89_Chr09g0356901 [Helianthus annuus]|nr:hypothetical protein HanHA89_Chr09g0356901 [Helianthus annuus]
MEYVIPSTNRPFFFKSPNNAYAAWALRFLNNPSISILYVQEEARTPSSTIFSNSWHASVSFLDFRNPSRTELYTIVSGRNPLCCISLKILVASFIL